MYKLIITELAVDNLDKIIRYISIDLDNPSAATEFLAEVTKCYKYLKNNPYIFSIADDPYLAKEGYRKALIKNYILFFKVNDATKSTIIYRFYAARDYFKYL